MPDPLYFICGLSIGRKPLCIRKDLTQMCFSNAGITCLFFTDLHKKLE